MEPEGRPEDAPVGVAGKDAPAVAKLERGPGQPPQFPAAVQAFDPEDGVPQLPAVGPGVHKDAAAHRPGDAVGKLHPRKALGLGRPADRRKAGPGPGDDRRAVDPDIRQPPGEDGDPADAFVGNEQVGALADKAGRFPNPAELPHQKGHLLGRGREGGKIRLAADMEGGVIRHRQIPAV